MKCVHCGAELKPGWKFCEECGTAVPGNTNQGWNTQREKELAAAGTAGALMGKAAREARLLADYSNQEKISDRLYNVILIAVVLWGLVVNIILCATVGDIYRYINPILFLVLYFVCCIAGIRISLKSKDPKISFLGYNMIVIPFGLVISTLVQAYGGISSVYVTHAFVYTALITAGMLGLVLIRPEFFQKLGGALLGCLFGLIICELILLLFRVSQTVTDWFAAGLFSLYIGYDIYRSQQFEKTVDNAVDSAIDIYMDIANLFIRLLRIMGKKKD